VSGNWSALALLGVALFLAGAAPDVTQRRAIPGHYNVPSVSPNPASPSPAATSSATPSAEPAATPENVVTNPGFESSKIDGGWYQCGDVDAYTTATHPYAGAFDEYSGTRSGSGEPLGNSGVCEAITIPPEGLLTAQLYQLSNEADTNFAYQEADLLDDRGNVVVNLYKAVNNKAAWVQGTWNLGAFAGRRYWLYFGVHGDGNVKSSTQQFVDDVTLTGRSSPPPE
jgi:hypothetical protein